MVSFIVDNDSHKKLDTIEHWDFDMGHKTLSDISMVKFVKRCISKYISEKWIFRQCRFYRNSLFRTNFLSSKIWAFPKPNCIWFESFVLKIATISQTKLYLVREFCSKNCKYFQNQTGFGLEADTVIKCSCSAVQFIKKIGLFWNSDKSD